ncbi:MAG: hypothetical protein GC191_04630 [Azospirillum sp.]|nr:hypothetical protein [Azospirillum sp.]
MPHRMIVAITRVGVDLSSVEDLTAVVAVFPADDDGDGRAYDVLATFFLPEASLAKKAEGGLRVTDQVRH